jgi:hypothetical protein
MSNSLSSHRAETCEPTEPEDELAQQQTNLIKSLLVTVWNFFGGFGQMFQGVQDPRHPAFITYPLPVMLTAGVLMFLLRLGARRQIGLMLRQNGPSSAKFEAVLGVETSPHGDSVDETFKRLIVEQVQESVTGMTEALIRKKVLYRYRLFDRYFLVSIDGTGMLTFPERHCPHCLTMTRNGRTIYYHPILEAKLVTRDGLVFSLMTEFVENPAKYSGKQDCELKAFYRLAKRLKKRFPRLPICLLLDGLFAGGPTFSICQKHHWKYIIVLREKDLLSVQEQFNSLLDFFPENHLLFHPAGQYKTQQDFHWVNDIEYVDSKDIEHTVSVVRCLETKPNPKTKTRELKTTRFKWITNFRVKMSNVIELANEGGRLRWKIENEGFNVQKNGGYALEHIYTHDPVSAKVFYLLLQIAHTIAQLIEYGSLFRKAFPAGVGSAKNIAWRLLEAWRNVRLSAHQIQQMLSIRVQIRLEPP